MVNPMSATSTCISRIIIDPLLVFCTAFHFNYELGKYQITEKFYQTTIKLIKYTCLIHFKKDLIPYIKLPNTHSVYLVRADFKEIFSTNFSLYILSLQMKFYCVISKLIRI